MARKSNPSTPVAALNAEQRALEKLLTEQREFEQSAAARRKELAEALKRQEQLVKARALETQKIRESQIGALATTCGLLDLTDADLRKVFALGLAALIAPGTVALSEDIPVITKAAEETHN